MFISKNRHHQELFEAKEKAFSDGYEHGKVTFGERSDEVTDLQSKIVALVRENDRLTSVAKTAHTTITELRPDAEKHRKRLERERGYDRKRTAAKKPARKAVKK